MEIESVRHKALRAIVETGKGKGIMEADRVRKIVAFLAAIETVEELRIPPNYGARELKGDRAGIWSLTVTKNWRMTFCVDDDGRVIDLDLEDYH